MPVEFAEYERLYSLWSAIVKRALDEPFGSENQLLLNEECLLAKQALEHQRQLTWKAWVNALDKAQK